MGLPLATGVDAVMHLHGQRLETRLSAAPEPAGLTAPRPRCRAWVGRWPLQPGVKLAAPVHDGWEVFHQLLRGAELPARLCSDAHLA